MQMTVGRLAAIFVVFMTGHALAAPPWSATARTPDTLRASDPQLRQAIEQGLVRSSTLRDLEAHLSRCAVIVYVSRVPLPRELAGRTRIIGTGGAWRYLLVEIDDRVGPLRLLTVLGHELQHAVEIAEAAEVVDADSLAALYRRIGHETAGSQPDQRTFETREAVEAGQRVRKEVRTLTLASMN